MKGHFSQILLRVFPVWVAIFSLFTAARLIFLARFHARSVQSFDASEALRVFAMAMRLDISIASGISAALLVVGAVGIALFGLTFSRRAIAALSHFFVFALVGLSLLGLGYYEYYSDNFNVFFWEFWQDFENAKLVVLSLPTSVSLSAGLLSGVLLSAAAWGSMWIASRIAHSEMAQKFASRTSIHLLAVVLILFGCRATFAKPLPKQLVRSQVSEVDFLNQMHVNAPYALYLANKDRVELGRRGSFREEFDPADVERATRTVLELDGEGRRFRQTSGVSEMTYRIPGVASRWLKRRPKHIVVLFMESLSEWPLRIEEEGFNRKIGKNILELRKESYSFFPYTFAGNGTLQNILRANLGLPMPADAPPEISRAQAFRPIATSLSGAMKREGYRTRFFFAGSSKWHNIGFLMQKIGFDEIFTEADCKTKERHTFGVHDQNLYELLEETISSASSPTFNFVMTISNHPPYELPENWQPAVPVTVPASLKNHIFDQATFDERMRAFAFADYALGKFMEEARKRDWFSDTLFFVTGDHTFGPESLAGINLPDLKLSSWGKILPTFVYAPHLMKESPRVFSSPGSHLDIMPTLLSLLGDLEREAVSFGRSLFDENRARDIWVGRNFSCIAGFCRQKGLDFSMNGDLAIKACDSESCELGARKAGELDHAFRWLGLYYLFSHGD